MQILLAFILGAALGVGVHFHIDRRDTRGVVLAPVIGAVAAGLAWTALTWAGIGIDTVWPWLAALIAPLAVTYPAVILLARARAAHDVRERARLKIG
ncbi:hypothetical protein [Microbacterium hominis]|uniref:Uncharacterized protein n=1 Tax=Microbacterium hominis TaxID=162426 RepID=A0A7D4PLX0_9MICO|nr:hypothetical protein [Microbacterium hominis]QKJ19130.1 hypothetical protein HQM25_06910 [Microbacterium hominis]